MPEGHLVFIHARDHQKLLAGKNVVVTSPQGRFKAGARLVTGKTIRCVFSLGKHLFYEFKHDRTLHIHLGRLGRFREHTLKRGQAIPEATPATRARFVAAGVVIDLSGPTACEVLDHTAVDAIRDRLGPDLLDPKSDRKSVWEIIHRRRTPIGALWMDQSIVSGIGNIFRAEVLYLCRLHPATPANQLNRKQFDQMWKESVKQMKIGVKVGRIVTVPLTSLKKPVEKLRRDERFNVYKRKTCRGCGAEVRSIHLASRPCYFCPKEQLA